MAMDQSVTMLEVSPKWLSLDKKSEPELMVLMLLVTQLPQLVKVLLLEVLP